MEAIELQSIAIRDVKSDKTKPHIRAALMRAWVDLQEIVMALRGQGKPKPVEAKNAVHRVKTTLRAEPTSKGEATREATQPTSPSEAKPHE